VLTLLGCPLCAKAAVFVEGVEVGSANFGGVWVQCSWCRLSSAVLFGAEGYDPRPVLALKWNARAAGLMVTSDEARHGAAAWRVQGALMERIGHRVAGALLRDLADRLDAAGRVG